MSDHMDFEEYPPIVYGRTQKRGSDGKFYFELDDFRNETSATVTMATQGSTAGLTVGTGKYFHLRYLYVDHGSGAYTVTLKNASGTTKFVTRVTSGVAANHVSIVGPVFNSSVYVTLSTWTTAMAPTITIGGVLDPNPSR